MKVNEVYGPVKQGEGKSTGLVVMFVRLAMCNLRCVWCDTKYTWDWKNFDRTKEVHEVSISEILLQLEKTDTKAVVISGGEPFLQQKELTQLLRELKDRGYWVEIETNGTIVPTSEFVQLIDQINCSPKLANSGEALDRRINYDALRILSFYNKVYFKFVVSSNNDITEILSLVKEFELRQVYLMPQGLTLDELQTRNEIVEQLAQKYGFKFSPRLHVTSDVQQRGV